QDQVEIPTERTPGDRRRERIRRSAEARADVLERRGEGERAPLLRAAAQHGRGEPGQPRPGARLRERAPRDAGAEGDGRGGVVLLNDDGDAVVEREARHLATR